MNYELLKQASVRNGFMVRLQQLQMKKAALDAALVEAAEAETLQKEAFARTLGRVVPRLGQAATTPTPLSGRLAAGAGRAVGKTVGLPISLMRQLLTPSNQPGMISRAVGGFGEGLLGSFGRGGQRAGQAFNRAVTRPVTFGAPPAGPAPLSGLPDSLLTPGATPRAARGAASPAAPGGAPGARAPRATPAPGTPTPAAGGGGGAATPPSGGGGSGGGAGGAGAGAAGATPGGDPTGGLLGRIRGALPQGAQNWMAENPNLLAAGAGALGGGALVQGGNSYGNYKRRQALQNAGIMDRLALAFQLATNPEGFTNTLRL